MPLTAFLETVTRDASKIQKLETNGFAFSTKKPRDGRVKVIYKTAEGMPRFS